MAEAKKEEKSIEDTFGELDLLARKLEDKETPLEESFRLYRQGMELLKDLNGRLDTVEKKSYLVAKAEDGTLYVKNMLPDTGFSEEEIIETAEKFLDRKSVV